MDKTELKRLLDIAKTFRQMGMRESEWNVYLVLLVAGQSNAAELSLITGFAYPTVISACRSLNKKGLVDFDKKNAPMGPPIMMYSISKKGLVQLQAGLPGLFN